MPIVGDLISFSARVMSRLGRIESSKLTPPPDVVTECIVGEALAIYESTHPRTKTIERTPASGEHRFLLTDLIPSWESGSYRVHTVARVTDPNLHNEMVDEIPVSDWRTDEDGSGAPILFVTQPIEPPSIMRIRYALPHVVDAADASKTSVPAVDGEGFLLLSVAALCRWIARTAGDLTDMSLSAEKIDYGSLSKRWGERAAEAEKGAMNLLSPDKGDSVASGTSVTWDTPNTFGGSRIGH